MNSATVAVPAARRRGLWTRFRDAVAAWIERRRAWVREHMLGFMLCGLTFTFLVVFLANRIFIFVGPGQAGVLFHQLTNGTQLDHVYGEGLHVIAPWNQMYIYDMRVQQRTTTVDALTSNGLTIAVTVSMRYYPEYKDLPLLHQKVGPDYATTIVEPEVVTGVREVIGKFMPEDLYTLKTTAISDAIIFSVSRRVMDKFIKLDAVNVTDIRLPALVTQAIEQKLTQEQVAQEYQFRIQTAQQEAERQRDEAQGIADFNRIVNATLSPSILQYRGIDATLQLATSPNAKVVVVGTGKDGLPLILNEGAAVDVATAPPRGPSGPAPAAPASAAGAKPPPAPAVATAR